MARAKSNPQVVLRPQDVVVLLRLALVQDSPPTYAALAAELGMTASEVHAAVERAVASQLARKDGSGKAIVTLAALRLFLLHGARYCFPATRGSMTRGLPTGHAAAPLNDLVAQGNEPPPVWPHKKGTMRGMAFYPLYQQRSSVLMSTLDRINRRMGSGTVQLLGEGVRKGWGMKRESLSKRCTTEWGELAMAFAGR